MNKKEKHNMLIEKIAEITNLEVWKIKELFSDLSNVSPMELYTNIAYEMYLKENLTNKPKEKVKK